jgi:hypothetical protein
VGTARDAADGDDTLHERASDGPVSPAADGRDDTVEPQPRGVPIDDASVAGVEGCPAAGNRRTTRDLGTAR